MRRAGWLLVLAAVACGATAGLGAQATTPQRYVVIGCISLDTESETGGAAPIKFIITDIRGEPPSKYELQGEQEQLRIHVRHMVEITGPLSPRAGVPALILKVQSLTYLSSRCSK